MYKNIICFFSFPFIAFCALFVNRHLYWLYDIPDAHAIFVVTPPAYPLHKDIPPSSMLPLQFTQYFCQFPLSPLGHLHPVYFQKQVYFSCFSVSSVWPFQHVADAIPAVFLLGHLRPVYFGQMMHFLLYHPYNLHSISKGFSSRYQTPGLSDLIVSQNLKEFCASPSSGRILVCAYTIC